MTKQQPPTREQIALDIGYAGARRDMWQEKLKELDKTLLVLTKRLAYLKDLFMQTETKLKEQNLEIDRLRQEWARAKEM